MHLSIVWACTGAQLTRQVTATALPACLTASQTAFNFGQQIIARSNRTPVPHVASLSLLNESAASIAFSFGAAIMDQQEGCRGVFSAQPKSGDIGRVRFRPAPSSALGTPASWGSSPGYVIRKQARKVPVASMYAKFYK